MTEAALITIVEDESHRLALPDLFRQFGYGLRTFSSAQNLSQLKLRRQNKMPIVGRPNAWHVGGDLQKELKRRPRSPPIIFISANGDEPLWPWLIELGASEYLSKPFNGAALRDAIQRTLAKG